MTKPKLSPAERLRLFEQNDVALIKRLTGVARGRGNHDAAERALRVFEAFLFGTSTMKDATPETDQWPEFMNTTIKRDLDHLSLLHFVAMVLEFHDGAAQAEKGSGKHADSRADKAAIRADYQADPSRFPNKNDAADYYEKHYPYEWQTIRDWLKGA